MTKTKNEKVVKEYERKYKLDKPRLVKPFGGGAHVLVPKEYIGKLVQLKVVK